MEKEVSYLTIADFHSLHACASFLNGGNLSVTPLSVFAILTATLSVLLFIVIKSLELLPILSFLQISRVLCLDDKTLFYICETYFTQNWLPR